MVDTKVKSSKQNCPVVNCHGFDCCSLRRVIRPPSELLASAALPANGKM